MTSLLAAGAARLSLLPVAPRFWVLPLALCFAVQPRHYLSVTRLVVEKESPEGRKLSVRASFPEKMKKPADPSERVRGSVTREEDGTESASAGALGEPEGSAWMAPLQRREVVPVPVRRREEGGLHVQPLVPREEEAPQLAPEGGGAE
mmetsp:Transcript_25777/g.50468  ORF Transcript_25777/g.50468 Transcript_25777/m.50468 type:complete len:148 (+) Transcript_25777:131-574(+)